MASYRPPRQARNVSNSARTPTRIPQRRADQSPDTSRPQGEGSGPPSSFFHSTRNVAVSGGHFNSVDGPHASVIINLNQGTTEGRNAPASVLPDQSRLDAGAEVARSTSMHRATDERVPQSYPALPLQKGSDIYHRHLSVKDLGYPLWTPEPNVQLPPQYRVRGITIGDVGIITPSGFDFLFNICSLPDDPVNPQELPEHFRPIDPALEAIDRHRHMAFKPNNYLVSASIERSERDSSTSGLTFESSAAEGAILTMPQGAYAEDLKNVTRFREYLAANAEHWYRYVNGVRGREAQNGDLRLVTGCHKAAAWGIAAFSNRSERTGFRLKFTPTDEGNSGLRTYAWEFSGVAEARAGPAIEEVEGLRNAHGGQHSSTIYRNQCLFVRTLNVTLRDDIWERLNLELNVQASNLGNGNYGASSDQVGSSVQSRFNTNLPPPNKSGTVSSTTNVSSGDTTSDTASSMTPVYIPALPRSLTDHPSRAINKMLLQKHPAAKMAITADQDWMFVLTEEDRVIPDAQTLYERIELHHLIKEEDGVVFLTPKPEDPFSVQQSSSGDRPVTIQSEATLDGQTFSGARFPASQRLDPEFGDNDDTQQQIAGASTQRSGKECYESQIMDNPEGGYNYQPAALGVRSSNVGSGDRLPDEDDEGARMLNEKGLEINDGKYSPIVVWNQSPAYRQPYSQPETPSRRRSALYSPGLETSFRTSVSRSLSFGVFHPSDSNMNPYTPHPRTPSSLPGLSPTMSDHALSPAFSGSPRLPTPSTPGSTTQSSMGSASMLNPGALTSRPEKPRFTHREQLQKFHDAMSLPMDGAGPFIPQQMFTFHTTADRKRYVEEVMLEGPLYFFCENPQQYGISLKDALQSRTKKLRDRDQVVLEGRGPSVSVRLEWPGYGHWSRQIPTKDFRHPPRPITLGGLAKNVAKCVQRFMQDRTALPMEEDADSRWKIGNAPNDIKFEDLVLVSIHHVSLGSWQPHLRLAHPLRPSSSSRESTPQPRQRL